MGLGDWSNNRKRNGKRDERERERERERGKRIMRDGAREGSFRKRERRWIHKRGRCTLLTPDLSFIEKYGRYLAPED